MKNKKNTPEVPSEEKEILKPMYHEGHQLKTRRDFLAQGFLGISAFALAPTALSLLSNSAYGADCVPPIVKGMTPVIIIDLAGGGSIAGSNVIVGGAGGQLDYLANYSTLGLPPDFHPSLAGKIDTEMGLAFHSNSGVLLGIRSTTEEKTRLNVEGAIFCSTSDDDTANNQSNPIYWLNKAGAKGQLQQLAGTSQSESGGNSSAPAESLNPSIAPVRISSNQDAINLVSLGNRFNEFDENGITNRILNSGASLSSVKLETINRRSLPDKIKALIGCGFSQTNKQIENFKREKIEPDKDEFGPTVFSKITNPSIRNKVLPITKLVLDGYIGAGTIVLGGYDYHDGTRSTGDLKDFELGQVMGAILELASRKNKDVVIYVLTDGGVSAGSAVDNSVNGGGKFIWTGDSGQRSSTFMLVHKANGRPRLRNNDRRQVGYFRANGAVENTALITSNSVVATSKAMVANYLALHGLEGQLESVVGDDPFRAQLDKYLIFDKL